VSATEKKAEIVQELEPGLGLSATTLSNLKHKGDQLELLVTAMEAGRVLARDLGGADPERMSPPNFAEFVQAAFAGLPQVKVTVQNDPEYLAKEYPLLHAVARASLPVKRHDPQVIRIEYIGTGKIDQTLCLVGKGVTYDTGGADVKTNGSMMGMSRDKCGAANVAGFLLTASLLKPKTVHVIAELGVVRNSVGSDSYVADEVIKGHSGVFVKVTNSDAEGRMVMADCLSHLRQDALANQYPSPLFMSMATLTGHAVRSVGGYTILLDNGPAKKLNIASDLQTAGDIWGDPFEISTLRREDFKSMQNHNRSQGGSFDVLQYSNSPHRGHQSAAAFMMIASGFSAHGNDSAAPLPYTYMDIAGSSVENCDNSFGKPTACCVVALTARYLIPKLELPRGPKDDNPYK